VKGLLRAALEREHELAAHISGYKMEEAGSRAGQLSPSSSKLLKSLLRLEQERKLIDANTARAQEKMDALTHAHDHQDASGATTSSSAGAGTSSSSADSEHNNIRVHAFGVRSGIHSILDDEDRVIDYQRHACPWPASQVRPPTPRPRQRDEILTRPLLVIIRHGKTEHNKLGLFTGWEDAPLANEGRKEAIFAGQLMKAHGIEVNITNI
jgi:Histidine phosphatase superfamily (branch 1)